MAECHPVGFQWVTEAKARGARVIHVDPRFTRTTAIADKHVPIRAGSDIVLLGALINRVLSEGLHFDEYVRAYTNATNLISENYQDTEDLDGLFSGFDPDTNSYDNSTWSYQTDEAGRAVRDESLSDPQVGVPDSQASLLSVHARDGGRELRHQTRRLRISGRVRDPELRSRTHHLLRLRGGLDPALPGRAVHPHRLDPPAPAGQHGPTWRRHHGSARARHDPGLDRHPDPVQPAARLPADAQRRSSRDLRRLRRRCGHPGDPQGLLGQRPQLRHQPAQGLVGRRGNEGEQLRLRLSAEDQRCPWHLSDAGAHAQRRCRRLLPAGAEPGGGIGQRADAAHGDEPPQMDGRSRLPAH